MGFPLSVPHVAPLDSPIGEWDRRCRVCYKRHCAGGVAAARGVERRGRGGPPAPSVPHRVGTPPEGGADAVGH